MTGTCDDCWFFLVPLALLLALAFFLTSMTLTTWRWAREHDRRERELDEQLRALEDVLATQPGPVRPIRPGPPLRRRAGRWFAWTMTFWLFLFYTQVARLAWLAYKHL